MRKIYFLLIITTALIISCKKESGEGGKASVKGKVYSGNYHSPGVILNEEDGEADERIYLVYGEKENAYDDDERTSHDGSFEFKFLRKGFYKLFAYSLDTAKAASAPMVPIVKTFEITDSKQQVEIDLTVFKEADKDGSSSIKGRIYVHRYNSNFSQIIKEYYALDKEVYLKYGNETSFSERIRTSYDGNYEFKGLRKGSYQVFVYSKDPSGSSSDITVTRDVDITGNNQVNTLEDLVTIDQ
ncbi:MAG: hypothetical protein M3Q58_02445 [Bacteroidota bacterium]|nr:hypothetical protein [Bacteroidota bacterium]